MEPAKTNTATATANPVPENTLPNSGGLHPLDARNRSALETIELLKSGNLQATELDDQTDAAATRATAERDLFQDMARRDPAMAALYITRKREELASIQQVEAVLELAEHTEKLEWIDHIVQMLNSGEYALPKSDGTAESPDRTVSVGQMDTLDEIKDLIDDGKIDADKSTAKSFFDAVKEYLSTVLPSDQVDGSVHDMIMRATGTEYDPYAMKFDQFKNMLQARRSAMSQDGTRLSTEHQYARSNIDQIKLQMSGMIDQMYGMMSRLASFS